MKHFVTRNSPLFILAVLCLVLAVLVPDFRKPSNLQMVTYRTTVVGIMAVGQVLVIVSGGIDLSVACVAAMSGVVASLSMTAWGLPMPLGVAMGALTGCAWGLLNGFLVTRGGIPPFVATLGTMMASRGAALLLAHGSTIPGLPKSFLYLGGTQTLFGMRAWWIPVVITVTITLCVTVLLSQTRLGRALYAVGGNAPAARLSGVSLGRVRTSAYVLSGLLAGIAGTLLASRTSVGDPSAAEGDELNAIAACVIGGASLMGGQGGAVGSLAGALIMNVLVNVCNLKGYNAYWQKILIGAIIVALVYYDTSRKRKAGLVRE